MRHRFSERTGLTLIELMIGAVLTVAIVTKAALVVNSALGLASDETASMHYEDQARRVVDKIALAIMGSDRGTLLPSVEEIHSDSISYSFFMGYEDGEFVWSNPERIGLEGGDAIAWCDNPGEADERRVVWSRLVSPLLEGEVINGVDDNGNGLIDEDGLSFVVEGDRVVIRLTLRRPESDGRLVEQTVESIVYCRN
jgi:hypothetical protein